MIKKLVFLISLLAPCVTPGVVEATNYYLGHYVWESDAQRWNPPFKHAIHFKGAIDYRSTTQCGIAGPDPKGWGLFAYDSPQSDSNLVFSLGTDLSASLPANAKTWLENNLASGTITATTIQDALYQIITTLADPTGIDKVQSLSPTQQNKLEFWIANNLLITKSIIPFESPEWANILASMQYSYASTREEDLSHGSEHYKKVLGAWMIQWGIEDHTIFLAQGIPDEGWAMPATSLAENWTCINNATSISCTYTWTNIDGVWGITSNQAVDQSGSNTFNYARAGSALSSSDMTVQTTVIAIQGASSAFEAVGVVGRYSSSANTGYIAQLAFEGDNSFNCENAKVVADVNTGIGTDTGVANNIPETVKLDVNGSTIKKFANGSLVETFTDSSIGSGNNNAGAFSRNTGAAGQNIEDTWTAADDAAGTTPVPHKQRIMVY